MAFVLSSMMELGTKAPNFRLRDTVSNNFISLCDIKSDIATVIVFLCNHCPFVQHINPKLVEIANKYQELGVTFIAISSNDVEQSPKDAPVFMKQIAEYHSYPFPYLYDEHQNAALTYEAQSTPDFFVFDHNMECAYSGRFDMTRPCIAKATGQDLCNALDSLIEGKEVDSNQYPSMGSSIIWKKSYMNKKNDFR
ncbi:AhpC/TSA family protein [Zobellia uliginosa]|uniref:AhpC/TSA family protein n=1 Tax=Zobellia uliginosa TaxID=143224 RepID=A0ABY1KSW3_9FLAO|nr:thioredoxin family protein [Zobellia uliginosa]SIS72726.1 AhpC/TSA family protein [Zobellia uliginosa]